VVEGVRGNPVNIILKELSKNDFINFHTTKPSIEISSPTDIFEVQD